MQKSDVHYCNKILDTAEFQGQLKINSYLTKFIGHHFTPIHAYSKGVQRRSSKPSDIQGGGSKSLTQCEFTESNQALSECYWTMETLRQKELNFRG